jgi:hypothetical protein
MKTLKKSIEHRRISSNPVSVRELQNLYRANSLKALLIIMGPFDPGMDGFRFRNDFSLTAQEAARALEIIPGVLLDLVHLTFIKELKKALKSIKIDPPGPGSISLYDVLGGAGFLATKFSINVFRSVVAAIIDEIKDPLVSAGGYCGGMAFGGYDFYLWGWAVHQFGSTAPASGGLHDYLFQRLLDSLKLNGATFVDWWTKVHVLPRLDEWVSSVVLATAGTIGGPAGIALGWWIGGRTHLFDLGGPERVLDPTKDQWSRIKQKLDAKPAWPVGLIFGNKSNLFDQHQVLAIGYTDNGSGTATLDIWDNNDRNRLNTLSIDFRGNKLEVSAIPGSNIANRNKQIRGIFLEEYTSHQPPSSLGPP